ncbi:MAG: MotA/TolQ/ExbB proton channel family protein, partial [Muribaculaceae bacterium]|nr:MotA/TolQ/ExbB proton channel family protein [Muribaculaceae bacterium]
MLSTIFAAIAAQSDTLAQVTDSIASTAAATTPADQELSVWSLCLKGGIIMIPLAILSIISIYILIERYLAITAAAKEDNTFMKRIKDYIHDGEIESAMKLCRRTDTPYSRLIMKGISRIGRPMNDVLVA